MNAFDQQLSDLDHAKAGAVAISTEPPRKSKATPTRHRHFDRLIFLLPLVALVVIIYLSRDKPPDAIYEGLEGMGVAVCFAGFGVLFIWRVARAMAVEEPLPAIHPTSSLLSSITSEPHLVKTQPTQHSTPEGGVTTGLRTGVCFTASNNKTNRPYQQRGKL